jgi:hypothetical protein
MDLEVLADGDPEGKLQSQDVAAPPVEASVNEIASPGQMLPVGVALITAFGACA